MNKPLLFFATAFIGTSALATDYHVSPTGDDGADGSARTPFRTISASAEAARPGDVITVHAGVYRERVTPPRGGESDARRITYQAASGEEVVIKGSEIVRDWTPLGDGVWKVTLPHAFFGDYNPYQDVLEGDWLYSKGRQHHTGEVYLNGKSLYEAATLEEVREGEPMPDARDPEASAYSWFCENTDTHTSIYANFHDYDPSTELVEINVRDACVYPDQPGRDFITVRGFRMSHAATQWAAPTAEQIGLIGTHWSKGWIIENNVISDSRCTGITLGKDRKSGHNVWLKDPGKGGADHYNEVIDRALENGWSKETIGSHIVRNNVIFNCEQAGICGSMGAAFSEITGNHIYNIWTKRLFGGAEMGGIKLHGAIDTLVANNRIHDAGRGLWMDWMAQGLRITGNLCYDNDTDDLFTEVNHGPYLVDNNLFLSPLSIRDISQGGAFTHNLIGGRIVNRPDLARFTPYHEPHSTALAGRANIDGGDNRFLNNVLVGKGPGIALERVEQKRGIMIVGYGLWGYDDTGFPSTASGNVYLHGAQPYNRESDASVHEHFDPTIAVTEQGENVWLTLSLDPVVDGAERSLVTTELLGTTTVAKLPYLNPDATRIRIDRDFFGQPRDPENPAAGPFELIISGPLKLRVW